MEPWICPRCQKVNAGWIPSCNCTPLSTINRLQSAYPITTGENTSENEYVKVKCYCCCSHLKTETRLELKEGFKFCLDCQSVVQ